MFWVKEQQKKRMCNELEYILYEREKKWWKIFLNKQIVGNTFTFCVSVFTMAFYIFYVLNVRNWFDSLAFFVVSSFFLLIHRLYVYVCCSFAYIHTEFGVVFFFLSFFIFHFIRLKYYSFAISGSLARFFVYKYAFYTLQYCRLNITALPTFFLFYCYSYCDDDMVWSMYIVHTDVHIIYSCLNKSHANIIGWKIYTYRYTLHINNNTIGERHGKEAEGEKEEEKT